MENKKEVEYKVEDSDLLCKWLRLIVEIQNNFYNEKMETDNGKK